MWFGRCRKLFQKGKKHSRKHRYDVNPWLWVIASFPRFKRPGGIWITMEDCKEPLWPEVGSIAYFSCRKGDQQNYYFCPKTLWTLKSAREKQSQGQTLCPVRTLSVHRTSSHNLQWSHGQKKKSTLTETKPTFSLVVQPTATSCM